MEIQPHLSQLPHEILDNIFSYIPSNQLLQAVNCVCAGWRESVSLHLKYRHDSSIVALLKKLVENSDLERIRKLFFTKVENRYECTCGIELCLSEVFQSDPKLERFFRIFTLRKQIFSKAIYQKNFRLESYREISIENMRWINQLPPEEQHRLTEIFGEYNVAFLDELPKDEKWKAYAPQVIRKTYFHPEAKIMILNNWIESSVKSVELVDFLTPFGAAKRQIWLNQDNQLFLLSLLLFQGIENHVELVLEHFKSLIPLLPLGEDEKKLLSSTDDELFLLFAVYSFLDEKKIKKELSEKKFLDSKAHRDLVNGEFFSKKMLTSSPSKLILTFTLLKQWQSLAKDSPLDKLQPLFYAMIVDDMRKENSSGAVDKVSWFILLREDEAYRLELMNYLIKMHCPFKKWKVLVSHDHMPDPSLFWIKIFNHFVKGKSLKELLPYFAELGPLCEVIFSENCFVGIPPSLKVLLLEFKQLLDQHQLSDEDVIRFCRFLLSLKPKDQNTLLEFFSDSLLFKKEWLRWKRVL